MKTIFRLFNFCLFLLVLALVFHNVTAKWLLTAALRHSLGVPVEVRDARVDFLNTQVSFSGIRIDNPRDFPPGVLAEIPKIYIDLEISSLWGKRLHFQTLEINFDSLHVLRAEDGRVNLLALKVFRLPERDSGKTFSPSNFSPDFYVEKLVLTLGRATYVDLSNPSARPKGVTLRMDHAVYRDLGSVADVAQIVVWETLKQMGIARMGEIGNSLKRFLG